MRLSVSAVVVSAAFALFLSGCQKASAPSVATAIANEEAPKIGYLAPNFRLTNLQGQEVSMASLEGKVVFINFWATWCGPCRAEMPSMEALYHEFKGQGLEILAVSSDMDGAPAVQPFIRKLGLSYPVLLDPDFRVDDKYLIQSVPTTVLVDKNGVITHRFVGARNWSNPESRDLIAKLLKTK
ncbi:MAG TPA: TlpA disulfide reductase family protein [Nitrospiria bacterium]|jgi:peroxiredoxin|nr:TlpA disulfide reductase family protein [Nitrospiria bacterium]